MFTFTFSLVEILFFFIYGACIKVSWYESLPMWEPNGRFFPFFIVLFVLIVVGMINLSRELWFWGFSGMLSIITYFFSLAAIGQSFFWEADSHLYWI